MLRRPDFVDSLKTALNSKDYVYLNPMNKSGGWGEIFTAASKVDNDVRVVKVFKEPIDHTTKEIYESDAKKLMEINHPNVVKYFDKGIIVHEDKEYFFLILEFIKGNSFDEIESGPFLETKFSKRLHYFNQCLDGINEFRRNYKLHRDLRAANIILSDEDMNGERTIKIIDPGTSKYPYDPSDEDVDLYHIKEEIFNLFFRQEELKEINTNANTKLIESNFPDLRDLFMNLSIDYLDDGEAEENIQNIHNNNLPFFKELNGEITMLNKKALEDSNEEIRYVMIGTSINPISHNEKIFDFNDEETEKQILNLRNKFSIGSPGGAIGFFGHFLDDFTYQHDEYIARFEKIVGIYNKTEHRIFNTGRILSKIIFHSRSGRHFLKTSTNFYHEAEESAFLNGSHIHFGLIPYLFMMLLKLAREIFRDQFSSNFSFSMCIISSFPIFMIANYWFKISNTKSIQIERIIDIKDLNDQQRTHDIIESLEIEFLRHFGYSMVEARRKLEIFREINNSYLNTVFKFEN